MSKPELEQVIRWLEAGREPLLIQRPQPVLQTVRGAWESL
jgi:hypothetical protein